MVLHGIAGCCMRSFVCPAGAADPPPLHFSGNTPADVGSGIGFVHNTMMFDHPEKSVVTGPWIYQPRPFW